MEFFSKDKGKLYQIRVLGPMLGLLLVVACGAAATATPLPSTAAPTTPKDKGLSTAAPVPTVVPASTVPVVSQGKVCSLNSIYSPKGPLK